MLMHSMPKMRDKLTDNSLYSAAHSVNEKETATTPTTTRKTTAMISRTTIKKDGSKRIIGSNQQQKKGDRSPLNIAINFATNESTQSVGKRSRASTARQVSTTKGVRDSGEITT